MDQCTNIKVRGYHLDMYGHVNHARYLEFFEEARWCYIEEKIDLRDWKQRGYAFLVVNININYRRPALLDQILAIQCAMAKIGHKSATIHQKMFIKGSDKIIADADVTFVVIDIATQKALPIEGELLTMLKSFAITES
jgi:thioesterase-3